MATKTLEWDAEADTGGTSLRGYLDNTTWKFEELVARLLTASGQSMVVNGDDKASFDFVGRFGNQPFTLYDYKADMTVHIGGGPKLDVEGLKLALRSALLVVEPKPFTHATSYDGHTDYGWGV